MTDLSIVDTLGNAGEAALDTVVGGTAIAMDSLTRPRRTAGRTRRRGSDVNAAIADAAEDVVDELTLLPERMLVAYVRMLRRNARRRDVIGTLSRGVLGALHRPARDWARFWQRLERETTVERGTRRGTATPTRGTVRGTARTAARKATTGARRTARTARGQASRKGSRSTGRGRGRTATARRSA